MPSCGVLQVPCRIRAMGGKPRLCKVCTHPEEARITAALLARLGLGEIARDYPGIGPYALKVHERRCLPAAPGSLGGPLGGGG